MTPSERAKAWAMAERAAGRCPRCRREHSDVNPHTGARFWRCAFCRKEQREAAKARYHAQ